MASESPVLQAGKKLCAKETVTGATLMELKWTSKALSDLARL
ncbi:hypothetical protein ACTGQE_003992 [Escherichia albertii]|nr:hypothetical protein [Escherichia albertii]MCU7292467.1 hypothetical protein [Escherichia albertii]MCZ8668303.1 hypothetical protein [Escherichia albertii]